MPRPMKMLMAVMLGCLLLSVACSNTELEETRSQLAAFQKENSTLHQEIDYLQHRIFDLEAEYENLTAKHTELEQWSKELVSSLGPGVWKPGIYERPIPFRFFKKASVSRLIDALNEHFESIQFPLVDFSGMENHTAVVIIKEGRRLTETIGTTGAQAYLGAVTYTLCSLDNVDCVKFEFTPGTHAVPGRYCR